MYYSGNLVVNSVYSIAPFSWREIVAHLLKRNLGAETLCRKICMGTLRLDMGNPGSSPVLVRSKTSDLN